MSDEKADPVAEAAAFVAAAEARVAAQARAAENARRVVAESDEADAARAAAEQGDGGYFENMMRLAEKATGLTREQLREEFAKLPPPPPLRVDPLTDPRWLARHRMELALAPELHIRAVADRDPIACFAIDAVRGFLDNPDLTILVLAGGVGTMRSGSACWMLSILDGAFVAAGDLLDIAIRKPERFEAIRSAKAAVFDDLGTENIDKNGYFKGAFARCLDGWYASSAKLIITTNITKDQFKQYMGPRVWDRCNERGQWADVPGKSVRTKMGTQFRKAAKGETGGDE
jgi:hypothetical protein